MTADEDQFKKDAFCCRLWGTKLHGGIDHILLNIDNYFVNPEIQHAGIFEPIESIKFPDNAYLSSVTIYAVTHAVCGVVGMRFDFSNGETIIWGDTSMTTKTLTFFLDGKSEVLVGVRVLCTQNYELVSFRVR